MKRTAFGMLTLLSLGLGACSSKAVDEDEGTAGQSGSTAGGMANGGSSSTAGSGSGGVGRAGSSATTGGSVGTAGTAGTGPVDGCTDAGVMCVDDANASLCDPLTGETEVLNCADEFAKDGLVSNGCTTDETGAGCTVDDLTDADCAAGTPAFAVCADATQEELIDIYVACFHNNMDVAHEAISCYADYIDEAAMTVDCMAADAACLPPE